MNKEPENRVERKMNDILQYSFICANIIAYSCCYFFLSHTKGWGLFCTKGTGDFDED